MGRTCLYPKCPPAKGPTGGSHALNPASSRVLYPSAWFDWATINESICTILKGLGLLNCALAGVQGREDWK